MVYVSAGRKIVRRVIKILTAEHREKIKYLNQYKFLNAEIDRKIKYMEDCKSKIFNVTGTLSDMPRSGNRSNVIEDGIVSINDIEQTINQDINELLCLRSEIENKINRVKNPMQREILKCRYLDLKKYEQIAVDKNIDLRWLYRLHEKALDVIKIKKVDH